MIDGVALKCLHSALEETTTTLLSNQQLDAAKTNRVLQMRQFEITSGDLQYLVKGALFGSAAADHAAPRILQIREDLIKGFLQVWDMDKDTVSGKLQGIQNTPKWKRTFHLRDMLWLLFYLKQHKFEQRLLLNDFEEASFILTKGVLRNFGVFHSMRPTVLCNGLSSELELHCLSLALQSQSLVPSVRASARRQGDVA